MLSRFLISLFFLISNVFALETTADEVSFDPDTGAWIFEKNAEVTFDQDGKENKFKADTITVYCEDKKLDKPKNIKALGHVSFVNEKFKVVSSTCDYDMNDVVFKGDVIITNNELGTIKSDFAKYNVKTKKIYISGKNRVKVRLDKDKTLEIQNKVKI